MAKRTKKPSPRRKPTKPKARAKAKAKGSKKVAPIPEYLHALTPNLVYKDAAGAIAFYQKVFGAKELMRMPSPDGKSIGHAELRIGDSVIFLNDEFPGSPAAASPGRPATVTVHHYVKDCDATIARALEAGATLTMPAADQFWGDRMGGILDPFGVAWTLATRKAILTRAQLRKAMADLARQQEPVAYPHEPGSEEHGPEAP